MTSERLTQDGRDLLDDPCGLLARSMQPGRRDERADDERDAATDDGVEPARERLPGRGHEGRDDGRLHPRLDGDEQARAEERGDGHGDHDHDEELDDPAAEQVGEDVADEHADRDPDHHLDGPPDALPVGESERDDRRHRCEEGQRVVEDVLREPPGKRRPDPALEDEHEPPRQTIRADARLDAGPRGDARRQIGGGRHTPHHSLPDNLRT